MKYSPLVYFTALSIKGAVRGILAITPIFVLYEALKRKKYNGAIGKCLKSQY